MHSVIPQGSCSIAPSIVFASAGDEDIKLAIAFIRLEEKAMPAATLRVRTPNCFKIYTFGTQLSDARSIIRND